MLLSSINQSVQIDLDGAVSANELTFHTSWVDYRQTNHQPIGQGSLSGVSSGATAKDICAAPPKSVDRDVKHIMIYNRDTASAAVTVAVLDGATTYILFKGTLSTGESLIYTDEGGWKVLTTTGALKQAASPDDSSLTAAYYWVGNASGKATAVAMSGDITQTNAGVTTIGNDKVTEAKVADSAGVGSELGLVKFGLALYDFAADGGGAPGAITLATSCTIPDNAVVQLDSVDVLTTFTSAGDNATVKVGLATDGDLSTAIAIDDASNPWDAGAFIASVYTPLAKKTTGARGIVLTSAVEALTAGKAVFCFRYWVSQ